MKLVEQFPTVSDYQAALSANRNNLGLLLARLGKREEARAEYLAAREISKGLVEQLPAEPSHQQALAVNHHNLGNLLRDLGRIEEARAEYQAALDVQKKLVERFPAVPAYQFELGSSYGNYAIQLIRDERKPLESLEWFDRAIRTLKAVHDQAPHNVTTKQILRNAHSNRAIAYNELQKPVEAVKDWDRAVELSPPDEQPRYRAKRATSQIRAGLVAEAVAEVAELTAPVAGVSGSPKWNAGQWYDFARIYAVAGAKIADKKQEYADRAMELLTLARAAGYKDAAHMKKDSDLDPLRSRDDFKKLLADLDPKSSLKPRR